MAKASRKISRGEKRLFFVTAFAIAIILGFGTWRIYVDAVPDVQIPTPKLPSPNAYDFYVKAGAAIIATQPPVDPIFDTHIVPKAQLKKRYPTAAKEGWLNRNGKALNLLRQGFKYQSYVPPKRSLYLNDTTTLPRLRALARLLMVESHARSERGNWSGAAESTLDALRLAKDVSRHGAILDMLISASIDAIARRDLWKILPHLNATQLKAATMELQTIINLRGSYADVLREEKYSGQASLLEFMRSSKVMPMIGPVDSSIATQCEALWLAVATPRRVVFKNYTDHMNALIEIAKTPYAAKRQQPISPGDMLSELMAPVYNRSRWNYARDEAGNTMLLVAMALRTYKLAHNHYPKTLNELVSNYLKKIPPDAFGNGEPLRYKISRVGFTLHSIGSDGIDNGGRAIENHKISKEKPRRFLMQPESKGDMVAGINY